MSRRDSSGKTSSVSAKHDLLARHTNESLHKANRKIANLESQIKLAAAKKLDSDNALQRALSALAAPNSNSAGTQLPKNSYTAFT